MKKLISAVLCTASILPLSAFMTVKAASSAWQSDSEMTMLLSGLNIMVGDDYGNFNLDSYVTRAEMSKIAIASSSYKNTVALGLPFSPFSDVKGSYWGAPYIRAAVSAGIVNGYMDGTFRPDGTVTYEEAITMMLRVLGYTNEDFGASYPYGQVGMAENLKMTEGMNSAISQPLTRRQVALLVCNSLDTPQKNSSSDLISVHNCSIIEDITIVAGSGEDSSLAADEISTTNGKYRIRDGFDEGYIGCSGDMVVKDGKYFVAFSADGELASEKYIIYSTLNDAILCYPEGNNTTIKQFTISSSTTCYKNSSAQTYGSLYSQMEMGDSIRIRYKDNGEIDYINYSEGTLEGPVKVVSSEWKNNFETNSSTKIVRDGKQVTDSSIQTNDIIYYSESLNMVLAYTDKVTGVYEDASPSKDLPQTVTISGTDYEVEGVEAFNDLSSNGTINIGDTVTVLLGRDGKKIAGVVTNIASSSGTVVGYITGAGTKEFKNSDGTSYSSYYVDVVTPDGTTYTYPTSVDKSNAVKSVAKISITNGRASVGAVSTNTLSGKADYSNMKIGTKSVADDIKIIDVLEGNTAGAAMYAKTYMQRLDGVELISSNVKYYATNSKGEITELILNNATGDAYVYGIVTKGYDSDRGGATVEAEGSSYSVTNSSLSYACGVKLAIDGMNVKNSYNLKVHSISKGNLTTAEAYSGSNTYRLSDKVAVYYKNSAGIMQISLSDAISGDYRYNCYYDKSEDKGGRIRVIVAEDAK